MNTPAGQPEAAKPEEGAADAAKKPQAPAAGGAPLRANPESRGKVYDSILDTIGNTPLVRIPRFKEKYGLKADILVKLEFFNPVSSVKDRIAFGMIEAAERAGQITPGKTVLIEPTSGNTGIGLAFIAASKGYRIILTMPESMSLERRKMLRLFGAELVLTPAENGMKGAIERAEQLLKEHDDSFMPSQFDNPANPQIHSETTAVEIWNDTGGKVDILVSGVGTGGTITGVSRVLKQKNPNFQAIAVEPTESSVISGGEAGPHKIQGIGAGFVPGNFDKELVDGVVTIDSETAFETAREVSRLEGIPCGISTGANIAAAKKIAEAEENAGKVIVTIGCSIAERYISTALFDGLDM